MLGLYTIGKYLILQKKTGKKTVLKARPCVLNVGESSLEGVFEVMKSAGLPGVDDLNRRPLVIRVIFEIWQPCSLLQQGALEGVQLVG